MKPELVRIVQEWINQKALLTLHSIRFAKTHDLNALRLLLPGNVSIGLDVEELERASRFAVESRYPGGLEPVTRGDAPAFPLWVSGKIVSAKPVACFLRRASFNTRLKYCSRTTPRVSSLSWGD